MPLPTPRDANARPCFTLKRALARGETRRLNLWEPRWLALLDALADANGGGLVGAELGCLLGHTRHYYGDDDDDPSRRVASVVVDNAFARARVVERRTSRCARVLPCKRLRARDSRSETGESFPDRAHVSEGRRDERARARHVPAVSKFQVSFERVRDYTRELCECARDASMRVQCPM